MSWCTSSRSKNVLPTDGDQKKNEKYTLRPHAMSVRKTLLLRTVPKETLPHQVNELKQDVSLDFIRNSIISTDAKRIRSHQFTSPLHRPLTIFIHAKFIILDQSMNSEQDQKLFDWRARREASRYLTGSAFKIHREINLDSSLCVWAGN